MIKRALKKLSHFFRKGKEHNVLIPKPRDSKSELKYTSVAALSPRAKEIFLDLSQMVEGKKEGQR